ILCMSYMFKYDNPHIIFNLCLSATAATMIDTLSLHDALPISALARQVARGIGEVEGMSARLRTVPPVAPVTVVATAPVPEEGARSEEHTSELQSRENLVCRLLLEKKKLSYTLR